MPVHSSRGSWSVGCLRRMVLRSCLAGSAATASTERERSSRGLGSAQADCLPRLPDSQSAVAVCSWHWACSGPSPPRRSLVAIFTVHWGNGLLATSNGVEFPLLYAVLALSLGLTGPGEYSIDAALGLNAWWTPQLSGIVLAAGVVAGLACLTVRRPTPAVGHA